MQNSHTARPVARINFGEVQDPQNMDCLNLTPLTLIKKKNHLTHFLAKSGFFADLEWCVAPLATDLHTGITKVEGNRCVIHI